MDMKALILGFLFFILACGGSILIPYLANRLLLKPRMSQFKHSKLFKLSTDLAIIIFCYFMGFYWAKLVR